MHSRPRSAAKCAAACGHSRAPAQPSRSHPRNRNAAAAWRRRCRAGKDRRRRRITPGRQRHRAGQTAPVPLAGHQTWRGCRSGNRRRAPCTGSAAPPPARRRTRRARPRSRLPCHRTRSLKRADRGQLFRAGWLRQNDSDRRFARSHLAPRNAQRTLLTFWDDVVVASRIPRGLCAQGSWAASREWASPAVQSSDATRMCAAGYLTLMRHLLYLADAVHLRIVLSPRPPQRRRG